jgi:hypothetical protein
MSYIGPITQSMLDSFIIEFQKVDTRTKITNSIIDPIVKEISSKLFPFFATLLILQVLIVGLVIYTLTTSNLKIE